MTTPTGTITMLDVILELDGVATPRQITLNDADVRGLAEVPTGEITMDDLRGKSSLALAGHWMGFVILAPAILRNAGRTRKSKTTIDETGLPGRPKNGVLAKWPKACGLPGLIATR